MRLSKARWLFSRASTYLHVYAVRFEAAFARKWAGATKKPFAARRFIKRVKRKEEKSSEEGFPDLFKKLQTDITNKRITSYKKTTIKRLLRLEPLSSAVKHSEEHWLRLPSV